MISAIPWLTLIVVLLVLGGLFVAVKGLHMPKDFIQNQKQREELRRRKKRTEPPSD